MEVEGTDAGAGVGGNEYTVQLSTAQCVVDKDVSWTGIRSVSKHHLSRKRVVKSGRNVGRRITRRQSPLPNLRIFNPG